MKRRHVAYLLFGCFTTCLLMHGGSVIFEYGGNVQKWDAKTGGRSMSPPGWRDPIHGYIRFGTIVVVTVGGMTACVLALRIIPKYAPGYLDKPYGHTEEDDEKETSDVSAKDR